MSEDPTTATEPTDEPTAQGTVEPDAAPPETPAEATEEAPPWGDDFDPQRAWNTIQTQRARETQLEQQIKALREDPQALNEFLSELGYELPDDEDDTDEDEFLDEDPDDDDEDDPLAARLKALEQKLAEQEQKEAAKAEEAVLNQMLEGVEKQFASIDGEMDEEQKVELLNHARLFPLTEDGLPDIRAAHDALEARVETKVKSRLKGWAGTKDGSVVNAVGAPGTQVPDLDDPAQRRAYMKQRLMAQQDS